MNHEEDGMEHTVGPGIDWVSGISLESCVQVLPPDLNMILKIDHEYI